MFIEKVNIGSRLAQNQVWATQAKDFLRNARTFLDRAPAIQDPKGFLEEASRVALRFKTPFTLAEERMIAGRFDSDIMARDAELYLALTPRLQRFVEQVRRAEGVVNLRGANDYLIKTCLAQYARLATASELVAETLNDVSTLPPVPSNVEILRDVPLQMVREILSHLTILAISKGCEDPCSFCALNSKRLSRQMPFKSIQSLFNEIILRFDQFPVGTPLNRIIFPNDDSDPATYYCPESGADFADVTELIGASPLFYNVRYSTSGWREDNVQAQRAAERMVALFLGGRYFPGLLTRLVNYNGTPTFSRAGVSFTLMKGIPEEIYLQRMGKVIRTLAPLNPWITLRYTASLRDKTLRAWDKLRDSMRDVGNIVDPARPKSTLFPMGRAANFKGADMVSKNQGDDSFDPSKNGYQIDSNGGISFIRSESSAPEGFIKEPTYFRLL